MPTRKARNKGSRHCERQRSNLVPIEAPPLEIATSPEPAPGAAPSGAEGAPRNDKPSFVLASTTSLASAAGLNCGTPPRLPGKHQGMLATDSGVATDMPDGPGYADLLVPVGGMMLRRMSAAGPKTSPA